MAFLRWTVIIGAWLLLLCLGIYAVDGISRGSQAWIGGLLFAGIWVTHVISNKLDEYKLRIERLESELGKHQRWHGHMTEFKE